MTIIQDEISLWIPEIPLVFSAITVSLIHKIHEQPRIIDNLFGFILTNQ